MVVDSLGVRVILTAVHGERYAIFDFLNYKRLAFNHFSFDEQEVVGGKGIEPVSLERYSGVFYIDLSFFTQCHFRKHVPIYFNRVLPYFSSKSRDVCLYGMSIFKPGIRSDLLQSVAQFWVRDQNVFN